MTISDQTERFFGKTVVDFQAGDEVKGLSTQVYRIGVDYDDEQALDELLGEFLDKADRSRLDALVIGMWSEPYETSVQDVINRLIAESATLPALKALFFGDMTFEQCEISWIIQGSYKALLDAFPGLQVLRIRGSSQLDIQPFEHTSLRQLIIECGGLPSALVHNLTRSSMPALEHLELWLGTDSYGFDGSISDYENLLQSIDIPRLRYLGLRDADISDDLAKFLAHQPWLAHLDALDLSLGTLGDEGAEALISSPYIAKLKRLDVSHHYMSNAVMEKLKALPIEVITDDQQDEEEYGRYVAVGE